MPEIPTPPDVIAALSGLIADQGGSAYDDIDAGSDAESWYLISVDTYNTFDHTAVDPDDPVQWALYDPDKPPVGAISASLIAPLIPWNTQNLKVDWPAFCMDDAGFVHFKGGFGVAAGATSRVALFDLPDDYIPRKSCVFICAAQMDAQPGTPTWHQVEIVGANEATNQGRVWSKKSSDWGVDMTSGWGGIMSLEGITYRAAVDGTDPSGDPARPPITGLT